MGMQETGNDPGAGNQRKYVKGKISGVELAGFPGKLEWNQNERGMQIDWPMEKPTRHAVVFKVDGLDLSS